MEENFEMSSEIEKELWGKPRFEYLSSYAFDSVDSSVPWYIKQLIQEKAFQSDTGCNHFISERSGDFGMVSRIEMEAYDGFSETACCSFEAVEKVIPAVHNLLCDELAKLGIDRSCVQWDVDAGCSNWSVMVSVFTPWHLEPDVCCLVDSLVEECYNELAERSWEIEPENLIEWEKVPPVGFKSITNSDGSLIEDDAAGLPAAAQKASERVPHLGHGPGPTAGLYEAGAGNYGVLIRIDALFKDGRGYIDRHNFFEASEQRTADAMRREARRFAWKHPDVTVMIATDEPDFERNISFQVFIPDSATRKRFDEIYERLHGEFLSWIPSEARRLDQLDYFHAPPAPRLSHNRQNEGPTRSDSKKNIDRRKRK